MSFKRKHLLLLGLALAIGGTAFKTATDKYFEISKNIELFVNAYRDVNTYYVDELDPSTLMRTGIDAMLATLDPYTNYISETDIEGYRYLTEGKYSGLGATLDVVGDYVTVIEPFENSPALLAGLKAGDQIVAIEGQSAKGKTLEEVGAVLRGAPGTSINLTVRRPGDKNEIPILLKRDEVNVPNVPYYTIVGDDIGYIALTVFTRDAGRNVADALLSLKEQEPNLKGVIFDLRSNGGGLLHEAVNVCNIFIPKGELVASTRGKVKDWNQNYNTLNSPVDVSIPLAVLINGRSASASEIVSGVMQDLDRGVLIGQQSFGKGLVQNTRDIGYNAKVKITTAKYYIPSGRCIQSTDYDNGEPVNIAEEKRAVFKTRAGREVLDGGGVRPDIAVEKPDESALVKSLTGQHLIFDFVTEYCLGIDSIADLEKYRFPEWVSFESFLQKRNFSYESESEKALKTLLEANENEAYKLIAPLQSIEQQLMQAKKGDLERYKPYIIDLIELDVASRFGYQKGKLQISLRNDAEVEEAIRVLRDEARYKSILKP